MKNIFLAGLIALSLFLTACGSDLPPEPGAPGTVAGSALAGKAVDGSDEGSYALPPDITLSVSTYDFNPGNEFLGDPNNVGNHAVFLTVDETPVTPSFAWGTGYIGQQITLPDGTITSQWTVIPINCNKISDTNWCEQDVAVSRQLQAVLPVNIIDGEVTILAYSCAKHGASWQPGDCNYGKWMRVTLVAKCADSSAQNYDPEAVLNDRDSCVYEETLDLPPEQGAPGAVAGGDAVN